MSTSSDRQPAGPVAAAGPSATQEIPTLPPADQGPGSGAGPRDPGSTGNGAGAGSTASPAAPPARPATGGHDLPPPRTAQRPATPAAHPAAAPPATSAAAPAAPALATAVAPAAPADASGSSRTSGHAADGPQPTGPVDFVPALPGGLAPAAPPAAGASATASLPTVDPAMPPTPTAPTSTTATQTAASPTGATATAVGEPPEWPESLLPDEGRAARPRRRAVRPADRQALAGLGLAVVAVALLEVGLLGAFGADPFWTTVTLWSAFATLCAVLSLVAFVAFYPAGNRLKSSAVWRLAAAGLVGLSVFWVLVVLPVVASDRGFVLTAALGCLGAALWIGPRRSA